MKKSIISKFDSLEIDFTPFIATFEDDDETLELKEKFWKNLTVGERNFFAIYADLNANIQKVSEFFNISWPTSYKYIKNIQEKIIK